MNIALFTDVSPSQLSGVIISTLDLAKGLGERGHKVFVILPKDKEIKKIHYKNVEFLQVPSITPPFIYPGFKIPYPFGPKIFRYIKKKKIDVIQFSTPILLGMTAIRAARRFNLPLVGTFHTSAEMLNDVLFSGLNVTNKLLWKYLDLFYNKCDLITAPSESIIKEMVSGGIRVKKKVFISNGVDKKEFNNKGSGKILKKYGLGKKNILYVGRVSTEKNLLYLLDVFKLISDEDDKVSFLFVGDGPQMPKIKERTRDLGLSKRIKFTGFIEHDKLVKSGVFGACNIFMTASETETQGITTLEAQTNGLVCIGIYAPGNKDLIKNDYNGFLIKKSKKEFADKAILLLSDEKLYSKMRKNTLEEIKKHSMSSVISKWETELHKLLRSS